MLDAVVRARPVLVAGNHHDWVCAVADVLALHPGLEVRRAPPGESGVPEEGRRTVFITDIPPRSAAAPPVARSVGAHQEGAWVVSMNELVDDEGIETLWRFLDVDDDPRVRTLLALLPVGDETAVEQEQQRAAS